MNKVEELLRQHSESLVRIETNLSNHIHHHELTETKHNWIMTTIISVVLSVVTVGINVFLKYK